MKTALFNNWTTEPFTYFWDGKGRTVPSGKSLWMPEYLARHAAKHLTNRELLRRNKQGKYVYPGGDKMTSPKFPEQVPMFMELFNRAFIPEEKESIGEKKDDIDTLIEAANRNRHAGNDDSASDDATAQPTTADSHGDDHAEAEEVTVPDDEDDEDSFGAKPQET